ncbi:fungal-specific transcription factor domain-containing protein [Mycena filopes]|nr:fungal-specific transcription factor domain-containing protein [Mycena filopes]
MSDGKKDTVRSMLRTPHRPVARRIQRACDGCRHKRRACDGLRKPNSICTNCIENKMECTYFGAQTPSSQQHAGSYTEVLEARLTMAETLLRKLSSDPTTPHDTHSRGSSPEGSQSQSQSQSHSNYSSTNTPNSNKMPPGVELLGRALHHINHPPLDHGFDAVDVDGELSSSPGEVPPEWSVHAASPAWYVAAAGAGSGRRAAWAEPACLPPAPTPGPPPYTFPSADLLPTLVGLYFAKCNTPLPLLHRPSFERALFGEHRHLSDAKFGAVVLLVCALGARWCDDPRIADGEERERCGYAWFAQVQLGSVMLAPEVADVQAYALAVQFLSGVSLEATWPLVGAGIRLAQAVGAHQRQSSSSTSAQSRRHSHTAEAELWRRAFYVLVAYDRVVSLTLRRVCVLQSHDFDVDLPTECDDEYWAGEELALASGEAWYQPPGAGPSRVSFFNAFMRLNNILALVLRIHYSPPKMKDLLGMREPACAYQVISQVDSALSQWADAIPDHLSWDPNRADPIFFQQSVLLYCNYYYVQMATHRPLISDSRGLGAGAPPSLSICMNAARSCVHIVDAWSRRMGNTPEILLVPALAAAGVILLRNQWTGTERKAPAPHEIAEVNKLRQVIQLCEERWQCAKVSSDILLTNGASGTFDAPAPPTLPPATSISIPNAGSTWIPSAHPHPGPSHVPMNAKPPSDLASVLGFESLDMAMPLWDDSADFLWGGGMRGGEYDAAPSAGIYGAGPQLRRPSHSHSHSQPTFGLRIPPERGQFQAHPDGRWTEQGQGQNSDWSAYVRNAPR